MKNTKEALKWIVAILQKHRVQFQISGGLAARIYGSKRQLADIDIDIPEDCFQTILPDVQKYVCFGPAQYKDENWDLLLLTLKYKGQPIELCDAYTEKIFDQGAKKWKALKYDLSKSEMKNIYGMQLPVIPKEDLVEYKKMLSRKVDIEDISQIIKKINKNFN